MRPSQAFHVLETLRNSSVVTLSRKGVELSLNDSQTVLDTYLQWLLLMMDLDYLHPETLLRTAQRLWVDLTHADVYELNNAFAECLQLVRLQSNKGFKVLCSGISTHLYSLIKDDIVLMTSGDVLAAGRLIQLFSYTSRLSLNDIDLTQQLLDAYIENEERISALHFDDNIIRMLNKIVKHWFGPFEPCELIPQHGPGGVAGHGRCSLEVKYKDLTTDALLDYAFRDSVWTCSPIPSTLDRISQTIFVPKSYKTFRTISMEPSTLQFYQQGVWKAISSQVSHSHYLRDHIGFEDQSRNRQLALEGSIYRNFATIDLSSASDSVSYDLVKKVFKGTWLLRYIVALRSHSTQLPDGRIMKLKKYAPMGSSLCFPIETIIFAAICENVTRARGVSGQYSVYGDDIIVPTQCVEPLMRFLDHLGFLPNREKSFYQESCWFRESCGGEFCNGHDVTPMRVSRKYASTERDVRLAKLIACANAAYERSFRFLRYFFVRKLLDLHYIPLFSPTSLLSDNYTNYHARKRWNSKLQRIEVMASAITSSVSQKNKERQDESIRYHHWLLSTAGRFSLGYGFQSVICRSAAISKGTWQTKPYEPLDQGFIDRSLGRE